MNDNDDIYPEDEPTDAERVFILLNRQAQAYLTHKYEEARKVIRGALLREEREAKTELEVTNLKNDGLEKKAKRDELQNRLKAVISQKEILDNVGMKDIPIAVVHERQNEMDPYVMFIEFPKEKENDPVIKRLLSTLPDRVTLKFEHPVKVAPEDEPDTEYELPIELYAVQKLDASQYRLKETSVRIK